MRLLSCQGLGNTEESEMNKEHLAIGFGIVVFCVGATCATLGHYMQDDWFFVAILVAIIGVLLSAAVIAASGEV